MARAARVEGDSSAMGLLPVTVLAAEGNHGGNQAPAAVSLEELSLYTAPRLGSARPAEPASGELERRVAALRTLAEPYTAWGRGAYDTVRPRFQALVRGGTDAYAYLKDPPKDFYPRAGVIGFSGVLGLLLARGSRAKRLVYPAVLVTVSASLYYPERAVAIARSSGDWVYESAVRGYASLEKVLKPRGPAEEAPGPEPRP